MSENPNPMLKPITCPRCGSRELAFVTEYHKAIGCRIFSMILSGVLIMLLVLLATQSINANPANSNAEGLGSLIAVLAIVLAFVKIIQFSTESQTHVQAICKDCGHLWLLD